MWVRGYERTGAALIPLPEEAWEVADAVPVAPGPDRWAVVMPLWTSEEGMSDLSMEVTVTESPDGISATIDNLHVL
jgi:hypothetical protein